MNSFFSSPQVFLPLLFLLVSHTCLGQIYFQDVTAATTPTSNDGAIALTAQGDAGPFTFSWSGPGGFTSSQQSIDQLPPGEYCVTVVNGIGCATTLCTDILVADCEPPEPGFIDIIPACPNASDGSIEILDPPANCSLSWSNGSSGVNVENLSPGSYCVTITDLSTRCAIVKCYNVPLASPIEITPTLTHSCYNSYSGAIELAVSGGKSSNYQYQWSHGKTGKSVYQLIPGYYCVTVTNPGSECKVTECFEINFKEVEEIELVTTTWNSCASEDGFDLESGRIHVFINAPGGDLHPPGSPYSFSWTPDISDYISAKNWFAQMITDLPSGTYCLNASSADGCLTKYTCIEVPLNSYQIDANTIAPSCENMNDGEIIIDLIDELPSDQPYTIEWSTGNEGFHLQNLEMGEYAATISSQNGCERFLDFDLSPEIELTIDEVIHVLPGGPLGSIKTTVKNPNNHNINLLWSNGQTTDDIFNLNAGTYTVTLTSDSGCEIIKEIEVSDCPAPVLGIQNFQPIDEDENQLGEISFVAGSPQPGYGPFTFAWTGPPGFVPPGNTQDLMGLTLSGEYCLTATNTCGASTTECVEMNNCEDAKYYLGSKIYGISFETRRECLEVKILGFKDKRDGKIKIRDTKSHEEEYKELIKKICGDKVIIEWPNGETATIEKDGKVKGKKTYTIDKNSPAQEYIVTIKDECGCQVEKSFFFGEEQTAYLYKADYQHSLQSEYPFPLLQPYTFITHLQKWSCCALGAGGSFHDRIFGLSFWQVGGTWPSCGHNSDNKLIYHPAPGNSANPCEEGLVMVEVDGLELNLGDVSSGTEVDISDFSEPETTCEPNVCIEKTGCLFSLDLGASINLPNFPDPSGSHTFALFFETPRYIECDNPIYDPSACNGNITYELVESFEDVFGFQQCYVNVLCQNETNTTTLASDCLADPFYCYREVELDGLNEYVVYRACPAMGYEDGSNCLVYDEYDANSGQDAISVALNLYQEPFFSVMEQDYPGIIECTCTQNEPVAFSPNDTSIIYRKSQENIDSEGIQELNIKVHPNPGVNEITFEITCEPSAFVNIEIFDITGKSVLHNRKSHPNSIELFVIDSNQQKLNPGLYFIRIQDSNGSLKLAKFVIAGEK